MKFFGRVIFTFIASLFAVWISSLVVNGFVVENSLEGLIAVSGLLTVISVFVRPFVKLILSPFIIITLGLFNLVINAGLLYLLDILAESITIEGLMPLIYATLIITLVNAAVNYSVKK